MSHLKKVASSLGIPSEASDAIPSGRSLFEFVDGGAGHADGSDPEPIDLTPEGVKEKALDLLDQALSSTGKRRIHLAKAALKIDPNCADAYILLAEHDSKNLEDAIALFRQAIIAGKLSLPEDVFDGDTNFWGWPPTRPYMRAKAGLAYTLLSAERRAEAIGIFEEMLRLNADDNQGVRWDLAACYLAESRDHDFNTLADNYDDDPSAFWLFAKALMIYRREGFGSAAVSAAEAASSANPYVFLRLIVGELPDLPPDYEVGEDSEAIAIIHILVDAWHANSEYLPALLTYLAQGLEEVLAKQTALPTTKNVRRSRSGRR